LIFYDADEKFDIITVTSQNVQVALFCHFLSTMIAAEIVPSCGAPMGCVRSPLTAAATAASAAATTPAERVGGRLDARGGGEGAAGAAPRRADTGVARMRSCFFLFAHAL